jgi:hypothetical protein
MYLNRRCLVRTAERALGLGRGRDAFPPPLATTVLAIQMHHETSRAGLASGVVRRGRLHRAGDADARIR